VAYYIALFQFRESPPLVCATGIITNEVGGTDVCSCGTHDPIGFSLDGTGIDSGKQGQDGGEDNNGISLGVHLEKRVKD